MISRDDGELYAECECGETHYGGTFDFRDFIVDLKKAGWRIRKEEGDAGEWLHICSACKAVK